MTRLTIPTITKDTIAEVVRRIGGAGGGSDLVRAFTKEQPHVALEAVAVAGGELRAAADLVLFAALVMRSAEIQVETDAGLLT